jgi:hypothetical protein
MKKGILSLSIAVLVIISGLATCSNEGRSSDQTISGNHKPVQTIGPGAGGGVFIPTISPFDTNLVFAKGDMTGAFVTYNGGLQWNLFNLVTVVQDFEFDPSDSSVVYASSRGYLYDEDRGSGLSMLFRSENKGRTWRVVYPDIRGKESLEKLQSVDFLPSRLFKGMPDGSIDLICVDPAQSNVIYLGLSPLRPYIEALPDTTARLTWLVGSSDRGVSWKGICRIPGTTVLGIYPHGKSHSVTVVTNQGCFAVDPALGTMRLLHASLGKITASDGGGPENRLLYILETPTEKSRGSLSGGMLRSTDKGLTWSPCNGTLLQKTKAGFKPEFRTLGTSKQHPEVVYLSVVTPATGPNAITEGKFEIYKSTASGDDWQLVYAANSAEVLTKNFNDSWLNRNYGPGWGGDVLTLGVSPTDPDICYATDYGQAYVTHNGGSTWHQVCSRYLTDSTFTTTGLDLTCCYGISFDPFDRNHLMVSFIDIGLFHSFDGGKSWQHGVKGIPANWVNTCYDVVFDPDVKGRVWSAWADRHSLPRKSQFGNGLFEGQHGGIARSDNGGKTWEASSSGIPENAIATDLLQDTRNTNGVRTLYACTFNQGVYQSVDDGLSWKPANKGMDDFRYAWEIRRAGKKLFLLCVRGWSMGNSIPGRIYCREDGADSWKALILPQGVVAPNDLLVDPANPSHMYLSCWPKPGEKGDVCGGVFETKDGGNSWCQCFDERIRVFAAAFDPKDPRKIYINTFQNAAYKSEDAGKSWHIIPGYRFKWGHCPVPDPNDPNFLFLTTYGVSIVRIPVAGIPDEFGRIENLPGAWW